LHYDHVRRQGCKALLKRRCPATPITSAESRTPTFCHSDAERGGGICDIEEFCENNVFDNTRSCETNKIPPPRSASE
jgi:hypothetical protein